MGAGCYDIVEHRLDPREYSSTEPGPMRPIYCMLSHDGAQRYVQNHTVGSQITCYQSGTNTKIVKLEQDIPNMEKHFIRAGTKIAFEVLITLSLLCLVVPCLCSTWQGKEIDGAYMGKCVRVVFVSWVLFWVCG